MRDKAKNIININNEYYINNKRESDINNKYNVVILYYY